MLLFLYGPKLGLQEFPRKYSLFGPSLECYRLSTFGLSASFERRDTRSGWSMKMHYGETLSRFFVEFRPYSWNDYDP